MKGNDLNMQRHVTLQQTDTNIASIRGKHKVKGLYIIQEKGQPATNWRIFYRVITHNQTFLQRYYIWQIKASDALFIFIYLIEIHLII